MKLSCVAIHASNQDASVNAYRSLRLVEKQPLGLSYLFGSVIQHLYSCFWGSTPPFSPTKLLVFNTITWTLPPVRHVF
jgi:hypothetical protein